MYPYYWKIIDDYSNVDGERKLSDVWTGFMIFVQLKHRPPEGYTWSRCETYEEANNLKTRRCMARDVEACPMQRKEKKEQKWTIEKPKLGDARRLRGIFFIEPNDSDASSNIL